MPRNLSREVLKESNSFRELLKDPRKKLEEAENIPAKWFRRILITHGVLPSEWERSVDRYYRRIHGDDVQKANTDKSNLLRALNRTKLTWARFETALLILGAEKYEFELTMHFRSGHTFSHKEKMTNRRSNMVDLPGDPNAEQ